MYTPIFLGAIAFFLVGIFVLKTAPTNKDPKLPFFSGAGTSLSIAISRFLYGIFALLFLYQRSILPSTGGSPFTFFWFFVDLTLFFLLLVCFEEIFPSWISEKKKISFSPISTLYQFFFLPFTYPIRFLWNEDKTKEGETQVKQEIIALIHEADTGVELEEADRDLIESVVTFHNRIAREIMVPRVDIFALPAKTTIQEAAKLAHEEGYSRIPVYKNSIDEIIGILMYKDVLIQYMDHFDNQDHSLLETPIENFVKKPLYAPETKKITHLLQEFQKKQMHMAVVVDEYGGTEGIVTIEDILEEIVGEIADEYDVESELFVKLPSGSWIVDAKMTILDVQEELEIDIPQEGDYDTVGGYIYHRAGTIPSPGFIIDHDEFTLEVLESSEKGVDKVRITAK